MIKHVIQLFIWLAIGGWSRDNAGRPYMSKTDWVLFLLFLIPILWFTMRFIVGVYVRLVFQ